MSNFLRSVFGIGGASRKRKVVGKSIPVDVKHVAYITDSAARLTALYELFRRYNKTQHAQKFKMVYEKTKDIHEYLVARNRASELELFHLQNTDHFISAFTAILEVHQQFRKAPVSSPGVEPTAAAHLQKAGPADSSRRQDRSSRGIEMVKPMNSQVNYFQKEEPFAVVPKLNVPEISINTFAKIPYRQENTAQGSVSDEIGFTSSPMEKEAFLIYVSEQLGIRKISYVGNALMNIPNGNGSNPTGMVPIIHWENFLYALNLNDFRLFPVKVLRKGA